MSIIRRIKGAATLKTQGSLANRSPAVAIAIGGAFNKLQQAHNQAAATKSVSNTKPVAGLHCLGTVNHKEKL